MSFFFEQASAVRRLLGGCWGVAAAFGLAACDPARVAERQAAQMEATEAREAAAREICFYEQEDFGRQGLRAQQLLGPGPKQRMVTWITRDFVPPDETRTEEQAEADPNYGWGRIAVQINWRVFGEESDLESVLESLNVHVLDVEDQDRVAAKRWELTVVDGERFLVDVEDPNDPMLRARFVQDQTRGLRVPGLVADSMGGVNGGRFFITVLDENGDIVADRDVRPPRGYSFKSRALDALQGLDERLAHPSGCGPGPTPVASGSTRG